MGPQTRRDPSVWRARASVAAQDHVAESYISTAAPATGDLLAEALAYAGAGIPVFPCRPNGKEPLTGRGFLDASTDPEQIRAWWQRWPDANIGIPTGDPSGWLVVDLDRKPGADGVAELQRLQEQNGPIPHTACARTGGGGLHLIFRHPGGIRSRTGVRPGIDVRGDGGYIVAPPSVHASGRRYEWVHHWDDGPPAEAPEWQLELLRGRNRAERPPEATQPNPSALPPPKVKEIRSALACIPADDRDVWLRVGMALHSTGAGDQALGLWAEWSQASEKYDPRDQRKTWESFRGDGVTLSSLFGLAKEHGWTPPPEAKPATDADVPRVELVRGREVDAVEEVLAHLRRAPNLYDFGDEVVSAVDGSVHPLNEHALRHYIGGLVQCWRAHPLPKGGTAAVLMDPPASVCRAILALGPARELKSLRAVVSAPTLRPDGTILAAPGYDPDTGLLMVPKGAPAAIPAEPTVAEAREALAALWRPFEKFPFCAPVDRAVHLAALLSAVVRPAVSACPAVGYDAPSQASGKTLLARCVGALATGDDPTVWPATSGDDDEVRKRLLAALRTGARVILWDNLIGTFDSAALAAALTSGTFTDRVLGRSEAPTLPNCALLLLTGNNLSLAGDLPRRVLVSRIDPRMADPYRREFAVDPLAYVLEHRQELVAAALTVVLGHRAAGSPRAAGRMASFERWDDLVRQPVAWVGREVAPGEYVDPMDAVTLAQAADPDQEALGRLLLAWTDRFGDEPVLVRELLEVYQEATAALARGLVTVRDQDRELAEALAEYKPARGELTAKTLGRMLLYRKERFIGGLRLEQAGQDRRGATLWRVAGYAGFAGFPQGQHVNEVTPLIREVAIDKPGKACKAGSSWEAPL
ncbi:MAG: bifunctional DNA primase/polymerase [Deltaproteobacteria bacterium]|nr:bifunctional DNA primase/polymerase [Deltaproteobacteria bacterium]